jgi:hypothetical protein
MGGRANPLRDAAAIVNTGQTGFAEEIERPEGPPAAVAVGPAPGRADASGVDGLTSYTLKTRDEVATTEAGAA